MKHVLSVALLVAWAGVCPAQTIKLPAEVKGSPGIPIKITAEADGPNVTWFTPHEGKLTVIDGGFFKGDSKRAMLFGPTGTYKLYAWTSKGDVHSERAECTVIIGSPTPPPPDEPDPPPDDPVAKQLMEAFAADRRAGLGTTDELKQLAEIYAEGAKEVKTFNGTVGDFYAKIANAGERYVPLGRVPAYRRALADEFNRSLPRGNADPLTDSSRKTIADKLTWASHIIKKTAR